MDEYSGEGLSVVKEECELQLFGHEKVLGHVFYIVNYNQSCTT